MRRLIVFLALIGASALFLGAAPGVASAANCSAYNSPTWWNGVLNFYGNLNCDSDTGKVWYASGSLGRWFDYYFGTYQYGLAGGGWGPGNLPEQIQTADPLNGNFRTFQHFAWCAGANHIVRSEFQWRISRKSTPNTYGPWHYSPSADYHILC